MKITINHTDQTARAIKTIKGRVIKQNGSVKIRMDKIALHFV